LCGAGSVTVVDQAAQPMTTLDPDMGAAVHRAMEGIGIDVPHRHRRRRLRDRQQPPDPLGADRRRLDAGRCGRPGLGVRPDTALAREAGLPLGDHGGLRTNVQMQVLGDDRIWAGGDCVEVLTWSRAATSM
jgi:NADPH-dependent 2,4-dienoyl-CoA reductase/sulfur reductase-like enzyme